MNLRNIREKSNTLALRLTVSRSSIKIVSDGHEGDSSGTPLLIPARFHIIGGALCHEVECGTVMPPFLVYYIHALSDQAECT